MLIGPPTACGAQTVGGDGRQWGDCRSLDMLSRVVVVVQSLSCV